MGGFERAVGDLGAPIVFVLYLSFVLYLGGRALGNLGAASSQSI